MGQQLKATLGAARKIRLTCYGELDGVYTATVAAEEAAAAELARLLP